jgi:hypothetical protein
MSKKPIPIGKLVDHLYEMRAKRIEAARLVDEMKRQEKLVITEVMERMGKLAATKTSGANATASIVKKTEPVVENWTKLFDHIQKTGEFDLLHQRIATRAWGDRHAEGIKVPGVSSIEVTELSLTKATRSV